MNRPSVSLSSVSSVTDSPWRLGDALAAVLLFLATAAVILWQNAHVAVLWDISYVLDSASRMAAGQVPYRDFPFVHPPLTFLVQAALIRFTGRVFFHAVLYTAFVGGLGTVLAWRMLLRILRGCVPAAFAVSLLLAAPLAVLGLYCILPCPSYDCDCAFSILVALWLLDRLPGRGRLHGLLAGAALCVPLFFKQNMGLPFLLAALGAVALALAAQLVQRRTGPPARCAVSTLLAVLAGAVSTLLAAALLLHCTAGIGNYLRWTIQFAAQRRLPGLATMLGVYNEPTLLWTLPCAAAALLLLRRAGSAAWPRIAAFALLAAPFVWTLCSLLRFDDADERGDSLLALWPFLLLAAAALALFHIFKQRRALNLRILLPIVVLAAIHGTFMSQQLWGSTYAIWPLLLLLVAGMLAALAPLAPRVFVPILATLIAATLLVCGGFYTASEERLAYVQLPAGPAQHSAFAPLAGMSTPGPFLPEFDELLRYAAAHIPFNDGLILIPGEDPFYFATGRVPRFPVLLFDPATDPYAPQQVAALARTRNLHWLIVKRDLQINTDPTPQRAATLQALLGEFTPVAHLRAYDIYRRP